MVSRVFAVTSLIATIGDLFATIRDLFATLGDLSAKGVGCLPLAVLRCTNFAFSLIRQGGAPDHGGVVRVALVSVVGVPAAGGVVGR